MDGWMSRSVACADLFFIASLLYEVMCVSIFSQSLRNMKNLTFVTDVVLPKESGSGVVSNFETFVDSTAVICYVFVKCEFIEEQSGLMLLE